MTGQDFTGHHSCIQPSEILLLTYKMFIRRHVDYADTLNLNHDYCFNDNINHIRCQSK